MILNRAQDCYENNKERLRGQTRDKHRKLSEEEKNKRDYGKNIPQYVWRKKRRLKQNQKSYCEAKKLQYNNE